MFQVGPWNVMCTIDKQKYRKDRISKNIVGETYNNDIHNVLNTFYAKMLCFINKMHRSRKTAVKV